MRTSSAVRAVAHQFDEARQEFRLIVVHRRHQSRGADMGTAAVALGKVHRLLDVPGSGGFVAEQEIEKSLLILVHALVMKDVAQGRHVVGSRPPVCRLSEQRLDVDRQQRSTACSVGRFPVDRVGAAVEIALEASEQSEQVLRPPHVAVGIVLIDDADQNAGRRPDAGGKQEQCGLDDLGACSSDADEDVDCHSSLLSERTFHRPERRPWCLPVRTGRCSANSRARPAPNR